MLGPVELVVDDDQAMEYDELYADEEYEAGDTDYYHHPDYHNGSLSSEMFGTGCGGGGASSSMYAGGGSSRIPCGPVMGLGRNRQTVLAAQNRADFVALELELGAPKFNQENGPKKKKIEPWCFPVAIMGILVLLIIFLPLMNTDKAPDSLRSKAQLCGECRLTLVETIPGQVQLTRHFPSTFATWLGLIHSAQHSIDIATLHVNLKGNNNSRSRLSGPDEGQLLLEEIVNAALHRGVMVRVVQNQPGKQSGESNDTTLFGRPNVAVVRNINMTRFLPPANQLWFSLFNTKLWIVDKRHFYLGSADLDRRSLSQTKELGIVGYNCSCFAEDVNKLFLLYWHIGAPGILSSPSFWPSAFTTTFNRTLPLLALDNVSNASLIHRAFFSSSPAAFCPVGRSKDIDALVSVIESAERFVYIAVMEYSPTHPAKANGDKLKSLYWPIIDDALRQAVFGRKVKLRLLVSKGNNQEMRESAVMYHLRSLLALNGLLKDQIEIKWFSLPTDDRFSNDSEPQLSSANIVRNKYMLTESSAYIGTSDWEGRYFISTAGASVTFLPPITLNGTRPLHSPKTFNGEALKVPPEVPDFVPTIRDQLETVFDRDWLSQYASDIQT